MNSATAADARWMTRALDLARRAQAAGEVPVGAILVRGEELLAEGCNAPISSQDPTAHAEILALRAAARRLGNYRLPGTTLYVTLEPCPMCAGALVHARVARLVFGAPDPLAGAAGSVFNLTAAPTLNHRVDVTGGVCAQDCAELLKAFFKGKR